MSGNALIPEWKKFLVRQLVRNQVSTMLCQSIIDKEMTLPQVANRLGKKENEVVHSLRPENINTDDIADICCAMDMMPVFKVTDVADTLSGGTPIEVNLSTLRPATRDSET